MPKNTMSNSITIFHSLIQHNESDEVYFEKAKNNFDFDDSGKYCSALNNAANLHVPAFAWLISGNDKKATSDRVKHQSIPSPATPYGEIDL